MHSTYLCADMQLRHFVLPQWIYREYTIGMYYDPMKLTILVIMVMLDLL